MVSEALGRRGGGQAGRSADEEASHIPTTLSLFEGQDDSRTVGMYAVSTISHTDTATACRMAEKNMLMKWIVYVSECCGQRK